MVAKTRALAEDACELVEVTVRRAARRSPGRRDRARCRNAHVIHPELKRQPHLRAVCAARGARRAVLPTPMRWSRRHFLSRPPHRRVQRGARLASSPTGIQASSGDDRVTGHRRRRHMMQNQFAKHLDADAAGARRVQGRWRLCWHQQYGTVCGRRWQLAGAVKPAPGQVVADRLRELRLTEHSRARSARDGQDRRDRSDGTITAWEIDDLTGIGPY